jgi:hypothetical protein
LLADDDTNTNANATTPIDLHALRAACERVDGDASGSGRELQVGNIESVLKARLVSALEIKP